MHGLRITCEAGFHHVVVQTDSTTGIDLIRPAPERHPHSTLVSEIRRWLGKDWEVQVVHVFRDGNFVADYLASLGHSLPRGVHRFVNPSATLRYWLYFDAIGVQTPRFINEQGLGCPLHPVPHQKKKD
ncbi:unnamed protein product [Linum trigynum]|uniref:RNase H type-1 domain-containing protein n=1 Tax=Linum trigynum TaxID=586398 RepID=A0AAV2GRH0_9ROSI